MKLNEEGPCTESMSANTVLDEAYLALIKDNRIYDLPLAESASLIAQQCARALLVSRASIWVSNEDQSAMVCLSLYSVASDGHESGAIIEKKMFPTYFQALANERVIDARSAYEDPRTSELGEPYLKPLDVHSLLDATFRHQGSVHGIVCAEMQGHQRDWSKEEQMFVASVADLVSQRLVIDDLAKSETKYQRLFESTTEGIFIFSDDKIVDVNPAASRIFRGDCEDIIGKSPLEFSPEFQDDGERSDQKAFAYIQACLQGDAQNFEWIHQRLDGTTFPTDTSLNQVRYDGQDTLFAIVRDITDRKEAERKIKNTQQELEYRASQDSLTGLYNRDTLHEYVTDIIESASKDTRSKNEWRSRFALLLMDLNRFKEINDTLGHATGDKVLVKISKIMGRQISLIGGKLFRLGGDEFVAVFDAKNCSESFDDIAKTVHSCLKTSIHIDDITMEMSASIGIALYPQNGKDSNELLRCADVAMYHAKNTDGLTSLYDVNNDLNNKRRLAMMVELGSAIRDNELLLHFQPRIQISTGELTGCEALVRWNHKTLGMVLPGEFLPLAEMSELIHPLTEWVLKTVVEQLSKNQARGRYLPIAMNISARNLTDELLVDRIEETLRKKKVPAYLLEIEITESALINHSQRALNNLHKLHKLGIQIAIDDFGTGYSSLSYLKKLPVDTLKIDKSFVLEMLNEESDAVIVDSTISLAHNFSLTVVAEGVEDKETLEALCSKNCEQAQGFFIAKPMALDDFELWLEEYYFTSEVIDRAS